MSVVIVINLTLALYSLTFSIPLLCKLSCDKFARYRHISSTCWRCDSALSDDKFAHCWLFLCVRCWRYSSASCCDIFSQNLLYLSAAAVIGATATDRDDNGAGAADVETRTGFTCVANAISDCSTDSDVGGALASMSARSLTIAAADIDGG